MKTGAARDVCIHSRRFIRQQKQLHHNNQAGLLHQYVQCSRQNPSTHTANFWSNRKLAPRFVSRPYATAIVKQRFWQDVSVKGTSDGLQILLDKRPVRISQKEILVLPLQKRSLAAAIALEWDLLQSSSQALKPHHIPLTSLTSRALDIASSDNRGDGIRDEIIEKALSYLETDTLLCWAPPSEPIDGKPTLRTVQEEAANDMIQFLSSEVWPGANIQPTLEDNSILPTPQSPETVCVVREWAQSLGSFELAGLERAFLATKSLVVASRLIAQWKSAEQQPTGHFGAQEAANACSLEVNWQTQMWGEVEDTHDVDREDLLRQLGSVIVLLRED